MNFDQDYLTDLVNGKSRGDFPPFSSGDWERSDAYLKQIVGRLMDLKSIDLIADFDHYGSGFSSYVHIYLSKKDKSDLKTIEDGKVTTVEVNGLMLYLCRMAPFAIYSESTWSTSYKNGKHEGSFSSFIEPEDIGTTPNDGWNNELVEISNVLNQFGIIFLTEEELNKRIDFKISIPTIFSDPPYKVFDCFFYWED